MWWLPDPSRTRGRWYGIMYKINKMKYVKLRLHDRTVIQSLVSLVNAMKILYLNVFTQNIQFCVGYQ